MIVFSSANSLLIVSLCILGRSDIRISSWLVSDDDYNSLSILYLYLYLY